ncbi:glycosyltransferase family 39 protein [Candidatus Woesearchaeota archaeon]|nr:glycosyltransferase family 39 protein [Candidatus Woesearchaeota archaeon]
MKKDMHFSDSYIWLVLLLLFVIALKLLYFIFRYHLIIWDEAVYLAMGKWIYSWGSVGLWEHIRPPGLPLMLGSLWKMGLPYVASADILMLGFVIGSVILTYLIARDLFGTRVAFISAAFLYLTPFFFFNSFKIMTGIPSMFFVLVSVYLFIKKRFVLSGASSAAAFLFRYPAGLIFVALNLIFVIGFLKKAGFLKKIKLRGFIRPFAGYNMAFLFILSALLVANKLTYGQFFGPLVLASAHQSTAIGNIEGVLASVAYYPALIARTCPFLAVFFLLFCIAYVFPVFPISPESMKKVRNLRYVVVPFLVFFAYFTIIPHKQERFALLFLPFLSIIASLGFYHLYSLARLDAGKKILNKKLFQYLLIAALVVLGLVSAYHDYVVFDKGFVRDKPEFVDDYYRFFDLHGFSGTILTSDPLHAAYDDNRYFHFYNNISDAMLLYKLYIGDVDAVIYNKASYPCFSDECEQDRARLEAEIMAGNVLVYNKTWWGEEKQIYLRPDKVLHD